MLVDGFRLNGIAFMFEKFLNFERIGAEKLMESWLAGSTSPDSLHSSVQHLKVLKGHIFS